MGNLADKIRQLVGQAKETWAGLSLNQRVLVGAGVLLVLIAVSAFMLRGETDYVVLYTELDEKDAAAIVEKLEEEKIDYTLSDGGTTILVPSSYKYTTRLKLASENLPQGEAGLEIFRESGFGETQTDKRIKYQYALQGELARTIQSLDEVEAAKVNLALPEESLFSDNEELAKASVVVRTKNGEILESKQVQAILNLVANSVEGLEPENVVIVDQYGNLMSDDLSISESAATETVQTQLVIKRQFESQKEKAIQTMLDKTLGEGNSVVRVNAEISFDKKEETSERYFHDEDGPFIRSEQIISESTSETGDSAAAGIPGTDTNIPQYQQADTSAGISTSDKTSKTRNYEINRTETVTQFSPGEIKYDYLTVSVLVNKASLQQADLGATEEERAEKIRSIVAAACGLRENRGDENVRLDENITVAFMDFYTEPEPEPEPTGAFVQLFEETYIPWIVVIAGLGAVLLVWLLMRRKRSELEKEPDLETVIEEEADIESLVEKKLTPEEKERQRIRKEIDRLIEEDPESAAQVIKAWLSEDSR